MDLDGTECAKLSVGTGNDSRNKTFPDIFKEELDVTSLNTKLLHRFCTSIKNSDQNFLMVPTFFRGVQESAL